MRKFLMVAAVGALALLMAVPAMAVDFKFGGEYRVRFYDGVNIGFDKNAAPGAVSATTGAYSQAAYFNTQVGPNARGAQIRIRPMFTVSDDNNNIQAVLRLEIGDIEFGNGGGAFNNTNFGNPIGAGTNRIGNGSGGGGGADGINVETKWAFLDFAMPFGVPARVRAGVQGFYLPKGMIIDDDAAGVRAYGTTGIVSYDLWWLRPSGGAAANPGSAVLIPCTVGAVVTYMPTLAACTAAGGAAGAAISVTGSTAAPTWNTVDNNYDIYGLKLDGAFSKAFNAGAYYLFADNRINCTTAQGTAACTSGRVRQSSYFGLTTTGDLGFMKYDADWIYGIADGGPSGTFGGVNTPVDVKGWAFDAHAAFPIGPVTANLAFSYATGDKRDGGTSEAYPGGFAPSWNGAGGGFELMGSGGPFDAVEFTQDGLTNTWMVGGWLEYRPVKALWLKMAYGYVGFASKLGNCAGAAANTCYGPSYSGKAGNLIGKSSLGQEISLRADYDIWTGFKVQGQLGWFVPSKGDVAGEYVLQLLYNF